MLQKCISRCACILFVYGKIVPLSFLFFLNNRVKLQEVASAQSPGTRPTGQQMREQLSV